jgi:hypothetical protein
VDIPVARGEEILRRAVIAGGAKAVGMGVGGQRKMQKKVEEGRCGRKEEGEEGGNKKGALNSFVYGSCPIESEANVTNQIFRRKGDHQGAVLSLGKVRSARRGGQGRNGHLQVAKPTDWCPSGFRAFFLQFYMNGLFLYLEEKPLRFKARLAFIDSHCPWLPQTDALWFPF